LWDTSATEFASVLGDDVLKWRNLLAEASNTRCRLESLQSSTSVGYVTIRYEKVKAQISVKFDSWQRDLQTAFAGILRGKIAEVYDEVSTARDKLESIHFEGGSTSTQEVIVGVTVVQEIKGKVVTWLTSIDQLIDSERVLRRQRYNFPWDWVESSRLKGQYQTLEQILSKRLQSIEENLPILQTRVSAEAKVSALRLTDIVSSWESEKPIKGTVTPYEALEAISKFEYGMKKAQRDEDNLIKAKDALGLDASVRNNTIVSCLAELLDIKEVWQYISKSFSLLQEIKDTPFATGNVRKIRQQLEDIMSGKFSLHPSLLIQTTRSV
jgi:dynein heavy chain 1